MAEMKITNEHDFTIIIIIIIIIECLNVHCTCIQTNKQTLTRIHRLKQNKFIDSIPNLKISERTSTKPVQHLCKTRDKINNNNTHITAISCRGTFKSLIISMKIIES